MATNIGVKLDCKKIEKARLYVGEKGTYLDATIIMLDAPDKYGNDGFIVQNVTEQERKDGVRGPILGNVKILKRREAAAPNTVEEPTDLPF